MSRFILFEVEEADTGLTQKNYSDYFLNTTGFSIQFTVYYAYNMFTRA